MSQSYAKISIDGVNGSGKSDTAARLAAGISIELADRAPVLAFDAEERWRFVKARIFDVEKVPLIIVTGQSLATLQSAIDRAAKEGACCFVGDQLTTPWLEGLKAFSYENGALPFDRRAQLMKQWDQFVASFRYGPFHSIACGRLGYHWENIEDEAGVLQLTQGDSKFNAGGGNNFGYEVDLELEIRRRKRRVKGFFRGRTAVEHVVDVIKDVSGAIQGKQFVFEESEVLYRVDDYRAVWEAFRPHIEFASRLEPPTKDTKSSRDLLVAGKTAWAKDQTDRRHLLEELDANLSMTFPSGEGKSRLAKMFRDLTLEYFNGYISWSRMEEEVPTQNLERNLLIVRAMRKRVEAKEVPTDHNSLLMLLKLAEDDVFHPGRNVTLLQAMGAESIKSIQSKRGPQPVVEAMNQEQEAAGD